MSSNKSIGIWCTPVPGADPIKIEVHFNYWRIRSHSKWWHSFSSLWGDNSGADFVEVGVMVEDVRQAEKLHIFIPMLLSHDQICDCSPYFNNNDIVQGIFNEPLKARYEPGPSGPLVLRRGNSHIYCRMHNFAVRPGTKIIVSRELNVRPFGGGTICTIESASIQACRASNRKSRAYFRLRFRISTKPNENPFVKDIPVFDRFILSGYEHVEYLDFRLNDARTLPTAVETRMANDQSPGATIISLVAFLTAVPVSAALSVTHTAFHKMRLLENDIWTAYADGIPDGMVVYHWRKKGTLTKPIDDFSAFVKLQIRLSGMQILIKYLIFALVFGVFGNLVAGWLQPKIGPAWSTVRRLFTTLSEIFDYSIITLLLP